MQQNHYEMTMKKKVPEFIPITIVGLEYKLAKEDYQSIKIGDFVRLKMEPDNKYDENAIAAYMERKKIGYVAKDQTSFVSPYISVFYDKVGKVNYVYHNSMELSIVISPTHNFEGEIGAPQIAKRTLHIESDEHIERRYKEESAFESMGNPISAYAIITGCSNYIFDLNKFKNFINYYRDWVIFLHRRQTKHKTVIGAYIMDNLIGYIPMQFHEVLAPFFRGKGSTIARLHCSAFGQSQTELNILISLKVEDIRDYDEILKDFYVRSALPFLDDVLEHLSNYHQTKYPVLSFESDYHKNEKDPNSGVSSKRLSTKSPILETLFSDYSEVVLEQLISQTKTLPHKNSMKMIELYKELYYYE